MYRALDTLYLPHALFENKELFSVEYIVVLVLAKFQVLKNEVRAQCAIQTS